MNESTILKISIITSLIGILLLLFIAERLELKYTDIASINSSLIDKQVKIKGYITSIKETPGLYILDVKDNTGQITAIIFKEGQLNLTKNKEIEILGTITKYQNQIEIQAKQIKA